MEYSNKFITQKFWFLFLLYFENFKLKKKFTLLKQAAEEKNVVSISCMSTVAQSGNQSKSSRYEKFPDLTLQQKKSDGKG